MIKKNLSVKIAEENLITKKLQITNLKKGKWFVSLATPWFSRLTNSLRGANISKIYLYRNYGMKLIERLLYSKEQ